MRRLSVLGVSLAALLSAQSGPLAAQDPILPDELGAAEEVSELDALSRAEDDPFAGVIEQETRKPVSVTLRALNKITARYTDLEISMNEIARFGSLEILPRTCDKRPPEEFPETTAFLEIYDLDSHAGKSGLKDEADEADESENAAAGELEVAPVPSAIGEETDIAAMAAPAPEVLEGPQPEGRNIFRGWMFASSPALNALEHPVYDVWVIDCKTQVADN